MPSHDPVSPAASADVSETAASRSGNRAATFLPATLWAVGGLLAWFLLLDLFLAPVEPQLEPSWMGAITHAAANNLQFGRDVIFTYGPLGYLAFSTFSQELVGFLIAGRGFVTGFYVFSLCLLARQAGLSRSVYLIATGLAVPVLSYQSMYLFALVSAGWLLYGRPKANIWLSLAALLFLAVAALVKLTFLFFAVLVLIAGTVAAAYHRQIARAALPPVGFLALLGCFWVLTGQHLSSFGPFLWTGVQITSGYSRTMNLPSPPLILWAGIATATLAAAQTGILAWKNRADIAALTMASLLSAALFLAWKLGFSRADAHTAEFFYFAILLTAATPVYLTASRRAHARLWRAAIFAVVAVVGVSVIRNQVPDVASKFVSIVQSRLRYNTTMLFHPTRTRTAMEAADQNQAQAHTLPRIKERVGGASVTVFGYEQAIALANRLNFVPLPTLQTYSEPTPALAEINAQLFYSERAPEFVIFKLQTIDNRLATIDAAEVLVQLAYRYEPVIVERGYLLLKRKAGGQDFRVTQLPISDAGETRLGKTIEVPRGVIWCQLELQLTILGKFLAFLYQPPTVELEIVTSVGKKHRRRIVPPLSSHGFLISPLLRSEEDFVRFASGELEAAATVKTIKVVKQTRFRHLIQPRIGYGFRALPEPSGSAVAESILRDLTGYSDIFSRPASSIHSPFPVDRFALQAKEFLLVHPPGEVRVEIPAEAKSVSGYYAIRPDAYAGSAGVLFQVDLLPGAGGAPMQLHQRTLTPQTKPADHGVQHFRCDLPPGATGQISLRTRPGPTGKIDWGWAGWAEIRFE